MAGLATTTYGVELEITVSARSSVPSSIRTPVALCVGLPTRPSGNSSYIISETVALVCSSAPRWTAWRHPSAAWTRPPSRSSAPASSTARSASASPRAPPRQAKPRTVLERAPRRPRPRPGFRRASVAASRPARGRRDRSAAWTTPTKARRPKPVGQRAEWSFQTPLAAGLIS